MIYFALGLAVVGLFLSALFSGSETGFYRATRLRLVLDALGGDRIARGLIALSNRPMLFVATILVGNNLANYLTSLAIVLGVGALPWTRGGHAAELIALLVLSPVLFVYGELLPKSLFLQAPNRLLRGSGPLLLAFVVLFLPISGLLWWLNRLLARLLGESPQQIRLVLARRELRRVLEEGHEAGLLYPVQRTLAQGIFAVAKEPVTRFLTPVAQLPRARSDMSKQEVLRLARRCRIAVVPVEAADGDLAGYVRVIDLELSDSQHAGPLRPLLEVPEKSTQLSALMRLQSARESLARVVDVQGRTVGIVTSDRLRRPLFRWAASPAYL